MSSNSDPLKALFVDSGAFSAWMQNAPINLDEYIKFIKENDDIITVYANLDVVGSPEGTLANQNYMEAHGLKPLPVFHHNEPESFLFHYLDKYDYLALGGLARGVRKNAIIRWLDYMWGTHLTNADGTPKIKVHGFGLTSIDYITRYPWYSIDSTSWLLPAAYGKIYVPMGNETGYDFTRPPKMMPVSNESPSSSQAKGLHFNALSDGQQAYVKKWVASLDIDFEETRRDYLARTEVNIEFFKMMAAQKTSSLRVVRQGFIK